MEQLFKKFNIKECKIVLERKNFDEFQNPQNGQKRKKDSDIVRNAKKICLQPERLTVCLGCGEHNISNSGVGLLNHICSGKIDTTKMNLCIEKLQKTLGGPPSQPMRPPPPPPPLPLIPLIPPAPSKPTGSIKQKRTQQQKSLEAELTQFFTA